MKSKFFTFIVISFLSVLAVSGQTTTEKTDPIGSWKFDAPYAPEGYTTGTIVVGFAEQKHTATMMFTGSEYKLAGEKVKIENDTLTFIINLEGQSINVSLKIESNTKMTGKAVYSEGEVPLTLTKLAVQPK